MKELVTIQQKLKAPKGQYNAFGKYNYRSCEDILESVKPILAETKCTLTLSDEMIAVCDRIYVKAIATLTNEKGEKEIVTAFAREEETKKGMDESQITGTTSSYARKYALNGLFCIDDAKDSDSTNTRSKEETQQPAKTPVSTDKAVYTGAQLKKAIAEMLAVKSRAELEKVWYGHGAMQNDNEFRNACMEMGKIYPAQW
ncbi:ERF family protein [Bacteroides salyersiae]|uniref:ERF family protein n=1 Tax=Bacteroides salyersiae TaxID=291644 RepID=UPI001CCD4E7E|nr:ERF family protein [Bacteroides salyersiae]UBD63965.1 ERF family protein [Bacteroides salyersiae]